MHTIPTSPHGVLQQFNYEQDKQCAYDVSLWRYSAVIVTVGKK